MDRILALLRPKREAFPELILAAGSLERADLASKIQLAENILCHLRDRKSDGDRAVSLVFGAPRQPSPLYAGAQATVPVFLVESWIDMVSAIDFSGRSYANIKFYFTRSPRG